MVFFLSFVSILILQPSARASEPYQLCTGIIFLQKPSLKLSDDEKRLVCGDKDQKPSSQAWADIPPLQAEISFKAMLQTRGYHRPIFENRNGVLYVDIGVITYTEKILVEGAPASLDINRKREIKGKNLTPAKLNELQDWVSFELKHLGYPCPEVDLIADEIKGDILVHIVPGIYSRILSIEADSVGDLHQGVVRRYDAFHTGEYFDIWNIVLTERRASEDDLIVASHINRTCTPQGVDLYQKIQPGLPRLFKVGVGVDSEQGPTFEVSSHYSRMNQRGSSIDNTLRASLRIQDFISSFNWYFLKKPSRFYFKPSFELTRDEEAQYGIFKYIASFLPTTSWDDEGRRWEASLGPSYEDDHTFAGIGPSDSRNTFLNENLVVTSHGYEYYMANPQSGYKFKLNSLTSNRAIASSVTASKLNFSGEGLWSFRDYAPPTFVVGLRGQIGTTLSPNGNSDAENLPLSLKSFLGGTQDLRGFSRQELPANQPAGAMSEAYLGLETRFPSLLPYGLQPFLFLEAGILGSEPSTFEWPLFWDPGLGIRWASPIGSFRGEVAHGFVDAPASNPINSVQSHWQFYISYGEEF